MKYLYTYCLEVVAVDANRGINGMPGVKTFSNQVTLCLEEVSNTLL